MNTDKMTNGLIMNLKIYFASIAFFEKKSLFRIITTDLTDEHG